MMPVIFVSLIPRKTPAPTACKPSLNWKKAQNTMTIGGQVNLGRLSKYNQVQVPAIAFNMNHSDPYFNFFTGGARGTNPGASDGKLSTARSL